MSEHFRTAEDYELFIYTLSERFPIIKRSTIRFIRIGSSLARVAGELFFENDLKLVIRERVIFNRLPITLDWYGYEIYQKDRKISWYDPQPHPNDPSLQNTFPHHKHIHPNIKNNRISAPNMSFTQPNIIALISEIESIIEK
jgi:hypothetical protein